MFKETVEAITQAIKISPAYLVAIAIGSGLVLADPGQLAQHIGVADLAKNYRPVIGAAFLLSCVGLIAFAFTLVARSAADLRVKRQIRRYLLTLTKEEKYVLWGYVSRQTKTQSLSALSGVTQGLVHAGVIYRSSPLAYGMNFAYNISAVAWDALNENPALLIDKAQVNDL